jgi:hypothetical protein
MGEELTIGSGYLGSVVEVASALLNVSESLKITSTASLFHNYHSIS